MNEHAQFSDEILVQYIDGALDPATRTELETKLKTDLHLQHRLEDLKATVLAVQYWGTTEKVSSIHKGMLKELGQSKVIPIHPRRFARIGVAAVASVILLFVAMNWFSKPLNPDTLYAEAFVDYPLSTTRSNTVMTTIESLYNQGNYGSAVKQAATGARDSLLVGLSYLKLDAAPQSLSFLNGLRVSSGPLAADAEYYLAMAYLKSGDYSHASALMKSIHGSKTHVYHNQFSQSYINKVDRLKSRSR
jgi:hypothetical protein